MTRFYFLNIKDFIDKVMLPDQHLIQIIWYHLEKLILQEVGEDITVVTYGAMVHETEFAAKRLVDEGYSIEIVDIRTIAPLDTETIFNSVKENWKSNSYS